MTHSARRRPDRGGVAAFGPLACLALLAFSVVATLVLGDLPGTLRHRSLEFLVLGSIACLGSLKRVGRAAPMLSLSIVSIVLVAAAALVGPGGAALIGLVAAAVPTPGIRSSWRVRAFNILVVGVLGGTAAWTYLLAGGILPAPVDPPTNVALLRVGLPLLLADLAMVLSNAALMGVMAWLEKGADPFRFARGLMRDGGLAYLGYGVIGIMLAFLWLPVGLQVGAVLLVIGPLFVAQWATQQVADETLSHDRTVSALVAAAEAENIYTAGHSERVAQLTALMARFAGRDAEQRRILRMAALLHDVGTVSIPSASWRGEPPYTATERRAYLDHPRRGVEMLAGITFLEPALPAIELHHERFDGSGYPYGYEGEEIPWDARAIAVADAFDSLTSTRSYREGLTPEEALAELRHLGGTQLDPELVETLAAVVQRGELTLGRLDRAAVSDFGPAKDHDDPHHAILLGRRLAGGR